MGRFDGETLIQRLPDEDRKRLGRLLRQGRGPQDPHDAPLLVEVAEDAVQGIKQSRALLVSLLLGVFLVVLILGLFTEVRVPWWAHLWGIFGVTLAAGVTSVMLRRARSCLRASQDVLTRRREY